MALNPLSTNEEPNNWDRLHNWIHCVCIVTFDLELGQAMEQIFPPNIELSEDDKISICYLAFPDSNSSCLGDTQFHVRVRQSSHTSPLSPCYKTYNSSCPIFLQINPAFYFGYVYFRQIKDQNLPRGYFQKSVVILSRLPFISLFTEICSVIATGYFDVGFKSVEVACHEINRWQQPIPGSALKLPLFGNIVQGQIPNDYSALQPNPNGLTTCNYTMSTFYPSIYDLNMFEAFSNVIYHVHILWELVITAEPLIVLAPSPTVSSNVVQALVGIIMPLMYNADYRPYFTIHDKEFKEYMTKTQNPPAIILGVTNPFFGKSLQHWPHIIRLTETDGNASITYKQKIKRNNSMSFFEAKTGVYTHYKPFLHKDKLVIKKILKGVQMKRPSEVQSAILRRHFLELTQSFIIPLERYMATLMPLKKNISPYKNAPHPLPFNQDDFLASLETSGPHLTSNVKGNWIGLYKKFFRCANFSGWYNVRYKDMAKKLKTLQLEALSHMNIHEWLQGKEEIEIVDMLLKIRGKLDDIKKEDLSLNEIVQIQLRNKLNDILLTLPEDLRNVIHIS